MKKCQGCQEPGDRTKALSTKSILGCVGLASFEAVVCPGGYRSGSALRGRGTYQELLERTQGHTLKGRSEIRKAGAMQVRDIYSELEVPLPRPQGSQLGTPITAAWNTDLNLGMAWFIELSLLGHKASLS